jgi:hypothetical protein
VRLPCDYNRRRLSARLPPAARNMGNTRYVVMLRDADETMIIVNRQSTDADLPSGEGGAVTGCVYGKSRHDDGATPFNLPWTRHGIRDIRFALGALRLCHARSRP